MKYFILLGEYNGRTEMVFGDYDKEVVRGEKLDMEQGIGDGYTQLRIRSCKDDSQKEIDRVIARG